MAIDPTSDVILDVIRAADPERAAAAAQRLATIGSGAAPAGQDFAGELARLAAATPAGDKAAKAKQEFEAMVLNEFVGQMLPKDSAAVFGAGIAGDMWKSMLADQVARQIAKSGALGLGDRLFATHALKTDTRAGRPGAAPAEALSGANPLSVAPSSSVVNGGYLFARRRVS